MGEGNWGLGARNNEVSFLLELVVAGNLAVVCKCLKNEMTRPGVELVCVVEVTGVPRAGSRQSTIGTLDNYNVVLTSHTYRIICTNTYSKQIL